MTVFKLQYKTVYLVIGLFQSWLPGANGTKGLEHELFK